MPFGPHASVPYLGCECPHSPYRWEAEPATPGDRVSGCPTGQQDAPQHEEAQPLRQHHLPFTVPGQPLPGPNPTSSVGRARWHMPPQLPSSIAVDGPATCVSGYELAVCGRAAPLDVHCRGSDQPGPTPSAAGSPQSDGLPPGYAMNAAQRLPVPPITSPTSQPALSPTRRTLPRRIPQSSTESPPATAALQSTCRQPGSVVTTESRARLGFSGNWGVSKLAS